MTVHMYKSHTKAQKTLFPNSFCFVNNTNLMSESLFAVQSRQLDMHNWYAQVVFVYANKLSVNTRQSAPWTCDPMAWKVSLSPNITEPSKIAGYTVPYTL